jgi:predicted dehydrogenase
MRPSCDHDAVPESPQPVRWGILSTGGIATSFVNDLRLLPDAEVLAVGSRTPDAAALFADRHRIPRAYGSWAELAADPEVDVVYVATPHAAHYAATRLCLEAGKAVLCEKPFTIDLPTAKELVAIAERRGVFLMEGMWTRCNPAVRRAVVMIADGVLGQVTSVQADFGIVAPAEPTHRLRAKVLGGGALLDLGVYPLTAALLMLGTPDHIRAWASLTPEGVDENTGLVLGYDTGAVATLSCGIVGETRMAAVVTGTGGRIEFTPPFFCTRAFTVFRAGADPEVVSFDFDGRGYQFEAAEVHRCLREGLLESPLVPHAVTLEMMSLLDTIRAQIGVFYT